jgi:hypothetical protein
MSLYGIMNNCDMLITHVIIEVCVVQCPRMKAFLSHPNPFLVIPSTKCITPHKDPTKKSYKNGRSMQKKCNL